MKNKYNDFEHFRREVLRGQAGPMASAAEEIADEIYHLDFGDEPDSLWDNPDADEE